MDLTVVLQFAWIGWLVLMLVFLVVEMLTLDFTFLMLGIGCVAGLAAGLLGLPLWLQVIVAAAVAGLLILGLRPPLLRRLHRGEDLTPGGVAALIGLGGTVLATVTDGGGQVRLANGDIWTARTDAPALDPGESIRVTRIDGATALVAPDVSLSGKDRTP